jgi:hypothetical protein
MKVKLNLFWMVFIMVMGMAGAASHCDGFEFRVTNDGSGRVRHDGDLVFSFQPNYFLTGWRGGDFRRIDIERMMAGEIVSHSSASAKDVDFTVRLDPSQLDEKTVSVRCGFSCAKEANVVTMYLGFSFPTANLIGYSFQYDDDESVPFPATLPENIHLASRPVSRLTMGTKFGPMVFRFKKPTPVLLQDSRRWSDTFHFRIAPEGEGDKVWTPGMTSEFEVEFSPGAPISFHRPQLTRLEANEEWVPLEVVLGVEAGSALDFSTLGFTDGPAGKHGWLKARDDHFEFEKLPGVPQRFYGVNFVGNGQVNPKPQSLELAERLHRLGYNSVRFHHHENDLIKKEPNCTTNLDPVRMDMFDYFFSELKKRGIYCTTDMYVSRYVKYKEELFDGEDVGGSWGDFKYYIPVHKPAMDNWKAFTRNFLSHRNPYTGMTYAEDPCMAMISMINEGTAHLGVLMSKGKMGELWQKAWNEWLIAKYGTWEKRNEAWGTPTYPEVVEPTPEDKRTLREHKDVIAFTEDKFKSMFLEMRRFIREELGCKALLTDMNYGGYAPWIQNIRSEYDYVDHHFYVDHPSFPVKNWSLPSRCPNESVIRRGTIGGTWSAFSRLYGKPFTITEYNYSGPGRYRGIGGILTGCLGSIQDWSGLWRFAYSHGNWGEFNVAVTNYFDLCRDPLNQVAERASLMLYMRGDMGPSPRSIAFTYTPGYTEASKKKPSENMYPVWNGIVTMAKVGSIVGKSTNYSPGITIPLEAGAVRSGAVFESDDPFGSKSMGELSSLIGKLGWFPSDTLADMSKSPMVQQSVDKQLTLVPERDLMVLDTSRTAGGFGPAGEVIKTGRLTVEILDTDATVWASSLDGKPLEDSNRILLNHLTDLVNSGMLFAEAERQLLLDWGKLPHLVRSGRAKVEFKHKAFESIQAWNLRSDGKRLEELPVVRTKDGFAIDVSVRGPNGGRMMYEIVIR